MYSSVCCDLISTLMGFCLNAASGWCLYQAVEGDFWDLRRGIMRLVEGNFETQWGEYWDLIRVVLRLVQRSHPLYRRNLALTLGESCYAVIIRRQRTARPKHLCRLLMSAVCSPCCCPRNYSGIRCVACTIFEWTGRSRMYIEYAQNK